MQFVVFTDKRLKFHLICCMLKALDQMNWEDCYQTSGKESALQFGHVYYCDVSDLSLPLLTIKVYEIWQMQANSWVSTYTAFFLSSGMEFHFCSSWLSSRKWETANKIFAMRIFFSYKIVYFPGKKSRQWKISSSRQLKIFLWMYLSWFSEKPSSPVFFYGLFPAANPKLGDVRLLEFVSRHRQPDQADDEVKALGHINKIYSYNALYAKAMSKKWGILDGFFYQCKKQIHVNQGL